ncbi:FeoB-associated Cys-rich membrane protein [Solitalea sp. MAHUQ-68]|uniref:FeoB-associated Cys-rich membrane protein n=1 Tax=Solitalea agri TaxID=2953739 RepID=A0A9X2F1G4_9SPHI|nr:FeoB-associated Cys-rich membrane protein [Solitalea agri]MCO4292922.1 FeoB-associated Cys-rich membrane protein [Solitalea agri]
MIQQLLVGMFFLVALWYVGRMVYRQVKPKKNSCGANCKCGVDFSELEKNLPNEKTLN